MNLKSQAISGAKWLSVSTAVNICFQFIQLIVLTKLLSPTDFGLMAMVMVVVGLAQIYTDAGISNAIIYKQDTTKEQLSSLYWLNIAAGFLVFALVLLLNPLVVHFYHQPKLKVILFFTSLIFLILPWGQQFQILLQKELKFKIIALIEMLGSFASMASSVALAIFGFGIYALVVASVFACGVRTLCLVCYGCMHWRPAFHFARKDINGYLGFGLYQLGEKTINYLGVNIDSLLIGKFLGPSVLGIYNLASQLVSYPVNRINPILTRVAFPIFAKKQDDNVALSDGYIMMSRTLAMISFPLLVVLMGLAPFIIPLVCGPKWNDAIPVIQILALVGMIKVIGNPSGSALLAKGKANVGFYWNVLAIIVCFLVTWFMVPHGIIALAWSYVFLYLFYFFALIIILHHVINLKVIKYMFCFGKPIGLSILLGLFAFIGAKFLGHMIYG